MGNLRKKGREDMGFWELVVLAVGLSMDAFAVSICKGLALQRVSWKECCIAGAWFGGLQELSMMLSSYPDSVVIIDYTLFDCTADQL